MTISPTDFRNRWCDDDDESLVSYPADSLVDVAVPEEHRVFLAAAGLPDSAAPFLDFAGPNNGIVQTAADLWKLPPAFDRYRVIGSNGSGDPLCIDESAGGQIVYLNHDCDFRRVVMNSSVIHLAESLLAFRHVVRETQQQNGEDAYLDGHIATDLQAWLRNELSQIDPLALQEDGFWCGELESMRDDET
ncbi:hypothetical protein Pla175_11680 [Pirellulimonas nuda]|uniref:SMI1 / KNR4 family protein n=1 Tax=Pirellulimonas nuda TaxID=2528009 RepID=A0A518D8I9_9BACT|nr:SUKH-4 family immunity protein [Pirellulimonas nuda]QDU87801.1 hypothetical protein Pla175_11680 [Pirellulimonas nuda]